MISIRGKQACVLHNDELLYSTYNCKDVHTICEDFFVIEETNKTLTFVYCSTLIVRLDALVYYKIIPKYGVIVYEEIANQVLGTLYTTTMERLSWIMQEEDYMVFLPQGKFNFLTKAYILVGFSELGDLVLTDKKDKLGIWNKQKQCFIQSDVQPVYRFDDIT